MHINLESQPSCARAWVAAASAIARSGEGYNVIIGVDDPLKFDAQDNREMKMSQRDENVSGDENGSGTEIKGS